MEVSAMKDNCDICGGKTGGTCYDVKTIFGSWAYICQKCFPTKAMYKTLGTGKGQKYEKDGESWKKVAG
jgi:ribosome-binding protein aMBF1 (putative translation factor)